MFKNTFQSGFLSILYSIGSKPLQIWDKKVSGTSWQVFVCFTSFGLLCRFAMVTSRESQIRTSNRSC